MYPIVARTGSKLVENFVPDGMTYCFVTSDFFPRIGGGENYVRFLSQELAKQNTVYVFCPNDLADGTIIMKNAIVCHLGFRTILGNKFVRPLTLYKKVRRLPEAILYASGPSIGDIIVLSLARILRTKCIVTYHADLDTSKFTSRLFLFVYFSFILNHFDAIVVQTDRYRETLIKRGIRNKKINLIPPGIVIENTESREIPRNESAKLLFVGQLDDNHQYKKLETLIEAMGDLPEFNLTVVGDGPLRLKFEELARALPNVEFVGNVSGQTLTRLYQSSGTLILPSNSAQEGFGVVLLEALSYGCQVITGEDAGGAELLKKVGLERNLYDGSPRNLASVIRTVNQSESEVRIDVLKSILAEYSWPSVANRVHSLAQHL